MASGGLLKCIFYLPCFFREYNVRNSSTDIQDMPNGIEMDIGTVTG